MQIKPVYQYLKRIKKNKIHKTDKDYLKENFNNLFLREVNSFKSQLLKTSEISPTRTQSQTSNINVSSILERLIIQLQGQITT